MRAKYFHISLLLACVSLSTGAKASIDVAAISKYVYPCNMASSPEGFTYMPDGTSYLMLDASGKMIKRYETATGKELETVMDVSHTRETNISSISSFCISPDGTKLLLYTDRKNVYRRSFKASYYVFEIKRNILRPLSKTFDYQQSPCFSPDGRMIAFVVDNNIYIKKWDYNSEVQVTTDGAKDKIINGIPDWTYEEEFSTDNSMAWAPDNSTLCFLKYNETDVPLYSFPLYEGYCNASDSYAAYPGTFTYKYPVAGQQNSMVTLHSYDVDTRKLKDIVFKDPQIEYIPRIAYREGSSESLIVTTLNRTQNRMELYSVNPKSTIVKSILVEQAKAWLNPMTYENLTLNENDFVMFSERSGWNHLYRYSYNGQLLRQITSGEYDVTDYYGTDALGFDYFQSTSSQSTTPSPLNRIVVKIDKLGKKTETLTASDGWASASFSPDMNFHIINYSNASSAPTYTLYNNKGKSLRTLEDNAQYASQYAGVPKKEFFTMVSDGVQLNGYIIKPSDFDPSRRYPVIMWQYSGPGSQEVVNRWKMDWEYYAAAEQGFIVMCVDGRGTGGRGTAFRDIVYKRLGYYETIDQLNAAHYAASLPFVDPERIGIAGWSYGGYETLMAVSAEGNPYNAAVAIAPVTSWRYYDTVYSERFMLTPQENSEGYDQGAPINRVDKIDCRLLLMSGTADDNVHMSNTIEFVSRLQENNRVCDMLLFPNMNHSINGCNSRALVYGKMIDYFKTNL